MSESTVLYDVSDGIATITLNRPHAKNALSSALMRDLTQALESAGQDEAIRVVILTGEGDAFCAGNLEVSFGLRGATGCGVITRSSTRKEETSE